MGCCDKANRCPACGRAIKVVVPKIGRYRGQRVRICSNPRCINGRVPS